MNAVLEGCRWRRRAYASKMPGGVLRVRSDVQALQSLVHEPELGASFGVLLSEFRCMIHTADSCRRYRRRFFPEETFAGDLFC